MTDNFTSFYRQDLARRGYEADPGQLKAAAALDAVARRLARHHNKGAWQKLRQRLSKSSMPVKGLYLWGGVGRGKTYLMDLFFDYAPVAERRRFHFHRFMQDVHEQLGQLPDTRDPLKIVANRLSGNTSLLCFDEFFVSDIGDAMILGNLFAALFENGVTLVATSNIPPAELYQNGLQRERFLPAIALLEENTEIVNIGLGADYRLRVLEAAEIYHYPLDAAADKNLARYLAELAPDEPVVARPMQIAGRQIASRYRADGLAWFDFDQLCTSPRGPADYLEIARICHTILLSNIPMLGADRDDDLRRFIGLVDVLYDRRVKLIVSAAAAPAELYRGDRLTFEYQRTQSRLNEMQQKKYLAEAHIP
ncbi:MAG: AFG1 family ATPase [Gammaproteobacteria bacterium]|nr:AFG1 family ATPase [Gammaproteobacteria bacterium]